MRAVRALDCPDRICCKMPFSTPIGVIASGASVAFENSRTSRRWLLRARSPPRTWISNGSGRDSMMMTRVDVASAW